MTAVNAARSQLQSAGTTLSASSVLDAATSSIVQPPAVFPFASVASADLNRLPLTSGNTTPNAATLSTFVSSGTAQDPHDAGVVDVSTGVKQLDPWGKYYVYCRWENAVANPSTPAIAVISAGPDGVVNTKCGDTVASGDDRTITSTVAETINRANVWQVATSNQVKFGIESDAVRVNQDGSLRASSLVVQEPAPGNAMPLAILNKSGIPIFTVTNTGVASSPAFSSDSGTFTALTVTNSAGIGSLGVVGAATVGSSLDVTGRHHLGFGPSTPMAASAPAPSPPLAWPISTPLPPAPPPSTELSALPAISPSAAASSSSRLQRATLSSAARSAPVHQRSQALILEHPSP